MRSRLLNKILLSSVLLSLSSIALGVTNDSDNLQICHKSIVNICDEKCVLACLKVLENDPYDALAHYRIALSSLNGSTTPFMPIVDTELRSCSEANDEISTLCDITYAAVIGYPGHFAIENRSPNLKSAYKWVDKAATRDHPKGRWAKAAFLASGTGTKRDLVQAYDLLAENSRNDKPNGPFALLYGILLDHGWGGPQNSLIADYYNRLGYEWLGSNQIRNLVDLVYLQMVGNFAYSFGDAELMHRTVWRLTMGKIDNSQYSLKNFELLLTKVSNETVAEFVAVEQIASKLGNEEAQKCYQEIYESLNKLHRQDILRLSQNIVKQREHAIAVNQEYAKGLHQKNLKSGTDSQKEKSTTKDTTDRKINSNKKVSRNNNRKNGPSAFLENTKRKVNNIGNSIADLFN